MVETFEDSSQFSQGMCHEKHETCFKLTTAFESTSDSSGGRTDRIGHVSRQRQVKRLNLQRLTQRDFRDLNVRRGQSIFDKHFRIKATEVGFVQYCDNLRYSPEPSQAFALLLTFD